MDIINAFPKNFRERISMPSGGQFEGVQEEASWESSYALSGMIRQMLRGEYAVRQPVEVTLVAGANLFTFVPLDASDAMEHIGVSFKISTPDLVPKGLIQFTGTIVNLSQENGYPLRAAQTFAFRTLNENAEGIYLFRTVDLARSYIHPLGVQRTGAGNIVYSVTGPVGASVTMYLVDKSNDHIHRLMLAAACPTPTPTEPDNRCAPYQRLFRCTGDCTRCAQSQDCMGAGMSPEHRQRLEALVAKL